MEPFTLALAVAALVVAGLAAAAAPYVVREFSGSRRVAGAPLYDRPVCAKALDHDDLFTDERHYQPRTGDRPHVLYDPQYGEQEPAGWDSDGTPRYY